MVVEPVIRGTRLMVDLILNTVLDPFCGTGTTMLAALKADRNSIGIELDPAYCRMAQRRLDRESRSLFG
jgi:site-specific DNA-methyltransferase (adenine-specific)